MFKDNRDFEYSIWFDKQGRQNSDDGELNVCEDASQYNSSNANVEKVFPIGNGTRNIYRVHNQVEQNSPMVGMINQQRRSLTFPGKPELGYNYTNIPDKGNPKKEDHKENERDSITKKWPKYYPTNK